MSEHRDFAAIILLAPDNRLVLQLRDNIPSIVDPNKLSIFAGRVEEGETHLDAAKRELFEETTLKADDLEYLGAFEKDPDRHAGHPGTCYIYLLRDVDVSQVEVHEGQGYRLVAFQDVVEDNMALISYDILADYFSQGGKIRK